MTNYRHKIGNRIVKYAFLAIIEDIMKANATARFTWMDEGFDSINDMVHFSSKGHKCILLGVGCPNMDNATIPLCILTEFEGEPNQRVDVTLNISDIHIKTMERIANEVYDTLWNPEENDDWEIVRQDYIEMFLDTYLWS